MKNPVNKRRKVNKKFTNSISVDDDSSSVETIEETHPREDNSIVYNS